MQLLERNQVGKVESFEELVAVVDTGATPVTSKLPKGKKQTQALHNWQVKEYQDLDLKGTPDGKDVTDVDHNSREILQMYWQYFRHAFGISTLAGESSVHGVKGEMAEQTLDAFVAFKRMIERRLVSGLPVRMQDDGVRGTEFRGMFDWLTPAAQADLPVPDGFRPSSTYSGTLANFDEDEFKALIRACYKETKGPVTLDAVVGIDLKAAMDLMLTYRTDKTDKTVVQCLDKSRNRVFEDLVEVFRVAGGTVNVQEHPFLRYNENGTESAGTHLSGLFLNMKMWKLNWNRAPNRHKLENRGGGEKAYIDALCNLICLNPLGQRAAPIDS